jgi:glycosyltransferase involved in cell wall biosynthesis
MNKFVVNANFLEKPSSETNGVLRFCREISIRLKSVDKSIQFISSKNIELNEYSELLDPIKVGVARGFVWEQCELPFFLYKNYRNFFLVNFNNVSPILYNKNISSVLDLTWKHFPETFDYKSRVYLNAIVPLVMYSSRKILTISEYSKSDILRNYPVSEGKIRVIYPGFYDPSVNSESSHVDSSLSAAGVNIEKDRYFLATMYKNPGRLIEAFKKLKNKELKLIFYGKLFQKVFGHLLTEINSSENIIYLGKVSDKLLGTLYKHALAFVYPTLNEGFGMPPLEAMNAGCPVIASRVASIPEVCSDAALYVNPYDIDELCQAMKMIYINETLRTSLVEKGKLRVAQFNYDKTVKELLTFLSELGLYKPLFN